MKTRLIVLLLLGLTAFGRATLPAAAQSDAIGNSVVIAQGVVTFTGEATNWRVYSYLADPGNPRDPILAASGFTLADSGALVVTVGGSGPEALLTRGEAAFSNDGDSLTIDTNDDIAATYRRIVLMPESIVDDETNAPDFGGTGFEATAGKREIELVRIAIPANAAPVTIFGGDDGFAVALMMSGTATDANTGDPYTSGDDFDVTGDFRVSSEAGATMMVARIGAAVRASRDQNAGGGPDVEATPDGGGSIATPIDGNGGSTDPNLGSLTVAPQLCSIAGSDGGCETNPAAVSLVIGGLGVPHGPVVTDSLIPNEDGSFTVSDLAFGDYSVTILNGEGNSYNVIGAIPDEGSFATYDVSISADNPNPVVTVQRLPPIGDGVINVEVYNCPEGLPGVWAQPWLCTPAHDGWALSLTSEAFTGGLTSADAPASESGFTFGGLPVGFDYRLSLDAYPDGFSSVTVKPDPGAEGAIPIDLTLEYSAQTIRFYAVTTNTIDLEGTDTDGDGLPDAFESKVTGTDPKNADTDGDSVSDGREVSNGTNPFDPTSYSFG